MIYKEKPFGDRIDFGITNSSGLMPLSRIRDNGILNNMPEPTKTTPVADMADALAGSARDDEERFSILEELRKQKAAEQEAKTTGKAFCRCRNQEERSLE